MSEMAAALRQFADRLEQGQHLLGPTACALVLSDAQGKMSATYIGRELPQDAALTHLLARGIEQVVVSKLHGVIPGGAR